MKDVIDRAYTVLSVGVALVFIGIVWKAAGADSDSDRKAMFAERAHLARMCAIQLKNSRTSRDTLDVLKSEPQSRRSCAFWLTADTTP